MYRRLKDLYPESKITKAQVDSRQAREFQSIVDSAKIMYLIQNHLMSKPIFFKGFPQTLHTRIRDIIDDETIELEVPPEIKLENTMTIYTMLGKFVEIDLRLARKVDKKAYQFIIIGSNIAKSNRQSIRFRAERGSIFINNIKTSANFINASKFNIPTSVKVVIHQFKPYVEKLADEVSLSTLDPKNPRHELLKRTMKTYYVRDATDDDAYDPLNEEFVDVRQESGNNLAKAKKYYENKGIRAEIMVPIIYITLEEESVPLGLVHLISYRQPLEIDKVLQTKELTFQIVDRIRAANTRIFKKRQPVLDIGRGGCRVQIQEPDMIEHLSHQPGFSFDLFFRMQAPISLYGNIRSSYRPEENILILGLDFKGQTARPDDLKRLNAMLEPLEKEYRKKLLRKERPDDTFRVPRRT